MKAGSKRGRKIASVLAFLVVAVMVFGLWPQSAGATENTVADDITVNKWHDADALDDSTKNIGRIWTDKSVSTGDITLTNPKQDTKTVRKDNDSDFLVSLSALSSTAKIIGQSTVPLDIVLVLDVSGSMGDPDRNGNKKIDKLKNAVNSFIDRSAEENDKRPANLQSRISLVKFAGDKTNRVGNDTYRDRGYTYNHTQIVRNYGAYTSSNKSQLKNSVNDLNPAGATAADNGMELAKTLVDQSKSDESNSSDRKNVQRVVIFFTDGQPTTFSDFSSTVANNAIASARTIKSDAYIYTIGVFDDADASITGHTGWGGWTDKEKFNAYMHGLSSNYPDATAYNNLGTRAKDGNGDDTQYYKAATNASDLNNIFTEIGDEIVASAQSPTEVEQGKDPNRTGYITLTDQLGDYMQVDNLNTLMYADRPFQYTSKEETTAGNKKTVKYIFSEDIPDTNHVYPEGNLKDIEITVEKATGNDQLQTGDLVTVKIPANLIPLRYYEIDKDGKMTIDETYPVRLFYDVSLKDGVAESIENPDALLQTYINANKDDEGQVHFYTNKYDKDSKDEYSDGVGAYAQFVPDASNDFYYFQNDEVLYLDEECTKPATSAIDVSGKTIYYYQRDYYELGDDDKAASKINTVKIPGNSNLLLDGYAVKDDKTGEYYIPAGTPRTTSLSYFTEDKDEGANKTSTAKTSLKPVWENDFRGKDVYTYLGNNGRMTFDLPGQLDISKTVKAEEGHAVPESLKDKEFEYKLELTAKEGSELKGEYTAQKYTGAKADGDSFKIKPGDTFTLKDGQTLKIYGLAPGTDYTVTETAADHFTGTVAQDNAGDNAAAGKADNGDIFAKGTVPGNDVASAAFTNTYKADPATLDGSANLKLRKDFVTASGRSAWDMDYLKDAEFTFYLSADGSDVPMPEGSVENAGVRNSIKHVKSADEINQVFGDIKYTKPGTYSYRITEKNPGADGKLGVSYSYASYTVTVTVTDEGGTLKAEAVMNKVRDENGNELENAVKAEDNTAVFRNVYDADSEHTDVTASKVFTDYTGSRQLKDGEYTFRITPKTAGAPLAGGKKDYDETTNTGIGVKFDGLTFTAEDARGATKDSPMTYEYTLEEVLPAGATAENNYTVSGVTYDPTKYTVVLKVYIDKVDGKDTVVLDRTYYDADGKELAEMTVPVFHNSYRADPVTLTGDTALRGDKTLTGRDIKDGEKFDFTLTAGDDSTAKAVSDKVITIASGGDKASVKGAVDEGKAEGFTFGDVTFTKEGTYTFDIKETVPDPKAGGMTYDRHTAKVTVVVTDDGNGKLKAAVSYDNGTVSDAADRAVFKNKYEASHAYSTSGGLQVEKVMNGRVMKAGEFTFTITPSEGAPAISDSDKSFTNPQQRGSGEADVIKKLQGLVFTEADAGKTYTYTVKETTGSLSGVTYDKTVYEAAIKVVDNGDGTMHTVTTITWKDTDGSDKSAVYDSSKADAGVPSVRFTNSYKAADADPVDITDGFSKVLTGREWKDSDSFTFTLKALTDGAPMPDKTEITVKKADVADGKAPISFGKITFTKAGVYKYEAKEKVPDDKAAGMVYDDTARVITVTVTDDGNGKLAAAVTAVEGSRTFTNKYETEDLPLDEVCGVTVTKVLYGHDMAKDQFEFSIKAADKASADKLKISAEDGATFGSLAADDSVVTTLLSSLQMTMTQEDIGKTYTYTFAETKGSDKGYVYDENQYKLEITTIDGEDGTLKAKVVLTNITKNEKIFDKTLSRDDTALGEKGVVIPFENRYDGSTDVDGGTKADVKADKTLTGRSLKADEFTFKLATKPADGSEGKVLQTVKNDGSGNIAFKSLSYRTSDKAAGEDAVILSNAVKDGYAVKSVDDKGRTVYTLSYRVYEDRTALPGGVSLVTGSFDFTVTVTDNGDGTLTAVTDYPEGKDKFGFVNRYAADDVDVDITGSKTLDHADGLSPADITGKFTFTLESLTDGAPMPDKTTAKNDAAGNVAFGKIGYTLDLLEDVTPAADGSRTKVFEYKVTETGSAAGVTNDKDSSRTFKVTLKDDGSGHLTVTVDPAAGPAFSFTNTYDVDEQPSSITDQIKITKELAGRDMKAGEFSFEMLEDGKVVAKGTNDAKGNVVFDKIKYTKPGTHTYTVREVKGTAGGVTYDETIYTVYTQVTDQGNGKLKVEHQVMKTVTGGEMAPAEDNAITFSNGYKPDATSVTVGAVKTLTGRDLEADQFTFQLKDAEGNVVATAKNSKSGEVSFGTLHFSKAGVYEYTISEVNDGKGGVTYDEHVHKLTVTVTDDGEGSLKAEVSGGTAVFANSYEASETDPVDITEGFSKVLTGRDWNSKDSFTFTIENTDKPESVENAPMPEKSEITVKKADVKDGKAPISFGNITFTKAGVYKYTVSEKSSDAAGITYDSAKRVITVTVTDNGTGKLTAAVTAVEGSRTFTNKYETEELPFDEACGVAVTKVLYGHDMAEGQFQFSIKAADKASADKMGIDADKGMTFGSQNASDSEVATLLSSLGITLKQEDIGKTYTYTFAETKGSDKGYVYDENQYKLEITTIDNEDGTLSVKVVMTNTTTGKEIFSKTLSKEGPALGEKGIVIPFENRYDGSTDVDGGTKAEIKSDKTMQGRKLRAGEFQFKLVTKPADGSEGKVLQTVKNDGSGNIAFKSLSYRTSGKAAGEDAVILSDAVKDGYAVKSVDDKGRTVYTLSYRVYEDQEDWTLPGKVTPVTDSFDFTVTVTDNGDGTLTAVTNYPDGKDKFGFVNQYATGDVDMDITGSKTLAHGDGLTPDDITGKFSFKLESQTEGAPMPEKTEAKNDAAGNVDFGKITFKLSDLEGVTEGDDGSRSKVFEYKVTETGSAAGVTNDSESKTFRITLHDDGNGNLTATKDPKEGPAFIFTNTYDVEELPSSITDQIKAGKDLTGRDLKDGEFSFEMLEDGEVVAIGKNDGNGNVTFSSITYKKPGTHTYTVREVKGTAGGVTYDENVFTVYTEVTDQGNGKLKAEHHVILSAGGGEFVPSDDNKITFSNSYKADPATVTVGALKKLIGRDLKDGEFTFLLKDADGKTVAKAKNDESGAVTFKELVFDKAGEYGYTVSEVNDGQKNMTYDKTVCKLTVKVIDDGEGVLKAELKGDKTVFTNTYKSDTPHKGDGDKPGKGASTGDDSSMTLALTLMMIAATVGCIVIVRRKISQ